MNIVPADSAESALNRHMVRLFTESDNTRGSNNTICPPEDEQVTAVKDCNVTYILL